MTMKTISVDEAWLVVFTALTASKVSETNAKSVAVALVDAELAGQGGHGLRRVLAYAAQAKVGKVNGHAVPAATRPRPGVLHIDADHGFAYPALDLAVEQLPDMARAQGIAVAGIHKSHHAGVAGLAVERLADAGLVALLFANAPAAMAPWGSRTPLFGTDPIAFACPVVGGAPIVVDVSLSKVARGKLMAAAQKGESIPEGWAFGPDGAPTTDPKAGMAGTMAPLGDAKGTALALMVELLCAGLTGANYASEASSYFDDKGDPPGTGQLLIAIDPAAFGGDALKRFSVMAAMVSGAEGARLPGSRRQELRTWLRAEGISVETELLDQLAALSA
jgi:(2R)-3-sulfolactate dehydrogenase (NADP+)